MSSVIEMSLEDIIKKKKIKNKKKPNRPNNPKNQLTQRKGQIIDARNKIISKKRVQITDAREKLAELAKQKDARLKLEQLRLQRMKEVAPKKAFQNQKKFINRPISHKDQIFADTSRQVVSQPLTTHNLKRKINNKQRYMGNRQVSGTSMFERTVRPKPIVRTVRNDVEILQDDDDDDPMGEELMMTSSRSLNRKTSLQLKIVAHNDDNRSRGSSTYRTAVSENDRSPPRPPSILKKRPMASQRLETKTQSVEKSTPEYRIIVSNLRSSVTAGDIEELFGDVGGMVESRLVRSGTAEVMYKTQEDAQKAVDLYHNRQLDGQPMNCLLVIPRSPMTSQRSSSKPALYSTSSNVEPDLSTFHKVLFSNM